MLSELVVEEYRQLKKKYPQEVLLLQVGIFYKILLEDARQLAGELGLKLITISKPEPVGPACRSLGAGRDVAEDIIRRRDTSHGCKMAILLMCEAE